MNTLCFLATIYDDKQRPSIQSPATLVGHKRKAPYQSELELKTDEIACSLLLHLGEASPKLSFSDNSSIPDPTSLSSSPALSDKENQNPLEHTRKKKRVIFADEPTLEPSTVSSKNILNHFHELDHEAASLRCRFTIEEFLEQAKTTRSTAGSETAEACAETHVKLSPLQAELATAKFIFSQIPLKSLKDARRISTYLSALINQIFQTDSLRYKHEIAALKLELQRHVMGVNDQKTLVSKSDFIELASITLYPKYFTRKEIISKAKEAGGFLEITPLSSPKKKIFDKLKSPARYRMPHDVYYAPELSELVSSVKKQEAEGKASWAEGEQKPLTLIPFKADEKVYIFSLIETLFKIDAFQDFLKLWAQNT